MTEGMTPEETAAFEAGVVRGEAKAREFLADRPSPREVQIIYDIACDPDDPGGPELRGYDQGFKNVLGHPHVIGV